MAAKKDYYDILGISKSASAEEIKAAYKRLAKKFHPDVSSEQNAEEKFKEVLEAYSVLSDPGKKANYDQFGHSFEGFQGFRGFGDFSGADFSKGFGREEFDFEGLFNNFGFGDIFGEMFGQGRQKTRPRRGFDLRYDLNIGFEEAAFGIKKEIEIERVENCPACGGSGREKGTELSDCDKCKGKGVTESIKKTFFGTFATRSTCSKCRGSGKIIKNPCKKCSGKGKVKVKRKIEVKIPEGIGNGAYLRLKEQGNAGEFGGEQGDLFIVIFIEPHKIFKRDKADLFVEEAINFSTAALGGEITVPILKGTAKLKIPSGTQTGSIFKLKGQGLKDINSGKKGDQFVKVIVKTPGKLSKKEKQLFEQLSREEGKEKKWF